MAEDSSEVVREQSEVVAAANLKVLGDAPAMAMGMVYQSMAQATALAAQNAVSGQQRMQSISEAATTAAVDKLLHADPVEAVALNKIMTGNDVAAQMQSLLAALNSGQQGVKSAQTTPPVTP